ncbi:BadM/Rrf2 family transcriptional regulator [Dongia mobilis]|uniref:BadM/Rrf2 family transcriptional regulator n=1 Tax=Dongia mobilis TaxID=578943 RepID=A0A4R6WTS4_9PROT|nr:Rrf2 family transcriptional regulator [Dongia mobilis]TDQ83448.1 BadM/Rrf2 family transcriptional regulator [Dongia mobilis]
MQLTQFTDFSLRVLIYLGLHRDRVSTIEEIASAYGISESHLTKVAHRLGRLGLVETLRGRNGGMRLKEEPARINVGATVRLMETNMVIVECFDPAHNTCPIAPVCALQRVLADAVESFLAVLDRYSLADMLENRQELAVLLRLPVEENDYGA